MRIFQRLTKFQILLLCSSIFFVSACGESGTQADNVSKADAVQPVDESGSNSAVATESNPLRNAYFGDTHIHTILSFDAYLMGTRRTPDEAYEFAKGAAIEHASGFMMQMKKPLDFLAVSDHAFYLGMMREIAKGEGKHANHAMSDAIRGANTAQGSAAAFASVIGHLQNLQPDKPDILDDRDVARSAWQEIIEAARRHNDPGNFTTFIGYEYTSSGPAFENLHRNVIFRGADVPAQPFGRLDSLNPEDLWDWMDQARANGSDVISIPHNSNGSNGWMFSKTKFMSDEPLDAAYAQQRMRNEPLVENTQVKGTSDTHPLLSPNDEWANFEIMPIRVASLLPSQPAGSYVREAYLNGLLMEAESGFNPFKFGVIGSSDTHNAAGSFEEDNYWSKTGITDIEPHMRGSIPTPGSEENPEYANGASQYWGASGLAGVWAESNTRDAIYDAFRRKETFSTSGPHIQVRFFAGFDLDQGILEAANPVGLAYERGVPMGADLKGELGSREDLVPSFYVWAAQDPDTQSLQRLQMIKGWVDDGKAQELVVDISCSDGLDPVEGRCPDNGATVDLTDCSTSPDKGDSEMAVVWQDPEFDPAQRAFYYVRVLENPSCRWSSYDAIRNGFTPRPGMHATIQDRAWTSPIWYEP
ncbi:MAG: DUF3604 domain-containing protein [Pseudomonadota bacterium]